MNAFELIKHRREVITRLPTLSDTASNPGRVVPRILGLKATEISARNKCGFIERPERHLYLKRTVTVTL